MVIKYNGIKTNIDNALIEKYKSFGKDFNDFEIRYLIESSGENHVPSNPITLKRIIEEGMQEIIDLEISLPNLAEQLKEQMHVMVVHM